MKVEGEAELLCGAERDERSAEHIAPPADSQYGDLKTKAGKISLQIIECYWRRESCVEEALVEMYLAGVSNPRVKDITEAMRGTKVLQRK